MALIDLTVTLNAQTPLYPGDPATKIEPAGVMERDGYTDHYISVGNHVGTHIDAPLHMAAGGKSLDKMPVDRFAGRGVLVDVTDGFSLERLQQADIKQGDIVLFRTGMSEKYHEPIYFEEYPVMSEEVANYLVEHKVSMAGVDAGSVDIAEGFPIHKVLLAGDVLIIENLTNLDKLTGKMFKVYALPVKLDVDAAPARVVAEVE